MTLRYFLCIPLVLLTNVTPANAEPVTLKCVTREGIQAEDLILDIERREMRWAGSLYDIVHVTDEYISAYERTNQVGGEVWVLDRRNGSYIRGSVAMTFRENESPSEARLTGDTYYGKCVKQLF